MIISWKATKNEYELFCKIVARAAKTHAMTSEDQRAYLMDINACHSNGCRLKLQEMLDADDFNFFHDFWGITKYINRETGKLKPCFLPRFAE